MKPRPPTLATQAEYATMFADRDVLHIDMFVMDEAQFRVQAPFIAVRGERIAAGRDFEGVFQITDAPKPVLAFTWARPKLIH